MLALWLFWIVGANSQQAYYITNSFVSAHSDKAHESLVSLIRTLDLDLCPYLQYDIGSKKVCTAHNVLSDYSRGSILNFLKQYW
jgi:hypothetical protein